MDLRLHCTSEGVYRITPEGPWDHHGSALRLQDLGQITQALEKSGQEAFYILDDDFRRLINYNGKDDRFLERMSEEAAGWSLNQKHVLRGTMDAAEYYMAILLEQSDNGILKLRDTKPSFGEMNKLIASYNKAGERIEDLIKKGKRAERKGSLRNADVADFPALYFQHGAFHSDYGPKGAGHPDYILFLFFLLHISSHHAILTAHQNHGQHFFKSF